MGTRPGRRYRLELDDGSREEVRPFFGPWLEPRALEFLRMRLPEHIRFVEEKPAGIFAQVRGDFWQSSRRYPMDSGISDPGEEAIGLDRACGIAYDTTCVRS